MKIKIIFFVLVFGNSLIATAQNNRLNTRNNIGWYNYFGTFKVSKKIGFHTEYQFHRNEIITQWQQSLLRLGINYQLNPKTQLKLGYAWIETFPYGEIAINGMGKDFTEHRLFQMVTITDKFPSWIYLTDLCLNKDGWEDIQTQILKVRTNFLY
jgi:hypothetical protein